MKEQVIINFNVQAALELHRQRSCQAAAHKMLAAARIQTAPVNPETPYVAPKWEPKPPATANVPCSDGTTVRIDKAKLQRDYGA